MSIRVAGGASMRDAELSVREAASGRRGVARYGFDLAQPADDPQLRRLLRSIRVDGSVSISMQREPNFFAPCSSEGDFCQVLAARDRDTAEIVGMGIRSVRQRYVDGQVRSIGYLSGLRISPDCRRGTLLARGYRFLRELDEDGRAEFYITTLSVGNEVAAKALAAGRAGLPHYRKIGRLNTWIIPRRTSRTTRRADLAIRPIDDDSIPALISFLERAAGEREFVPCYRERDLRLPSDVFRGMRPTDLKGLWLDNQLVATLGVWDQRGMKQIVVERYGWWLAAARPVYNLVAPVIGRPRFPSPGDCLPLVCAMLPLATRAGRHRFGELIDCVAADLPPEVDGIMFGLSDNDPLTASVRSRAIHMYPADIFLVSWDRERIESRNWQESIPYLELGTL
ncbi:MAG: hypothetical protein U0795_19235 [Pirellulales bacterium]